jgi:hypothetical protein
LQQARELGRLEAKLAAKPKAPQVSAAPPPAARLAGSSPVVEKAPSEMSDTEYRKWREKTIARRRGFEKV